MPEFEDTPDLEAAMARLDAAEAAEQPIAREHQVQADGELPAKAPEQTANDGIANPDSLSTDTPAAADTKPAEPISKQTPPDPKASSFAKDKVRRDDSWKALNTEKSAFQQERSQFEALKQSHSREVERFQVERAKANQKFTPEQYEQAAQQRETAIGGLNEQAEAWEARAEKLEGAGDFKGAAQAKLQADNLKEQALASKLQARQFKDMAAQLRQNPDPTMEQVKAKNEHAMREYTLQAVSKWPKFAEQNGEFQKKVAQELQAARQQGLEVNEVPVLLYHAARLVAAETEAARVPVLDKELGQLRAKVKELEALTAPGGGSGSIQRQPTGNVAKSDEEEGAELRSLAATF